MAMMRHPFFSDDFWGHPMIPDRLFNQNFGMGIMDEASEEMKQMETMMNQMATRPRHRQGHRHMPIESTGTSEVVNTAEKFAVNLNVSHFAPEEIKVKTTERDLIVEGTHEERPDEHGFIKRQFSRRYLLPKDVDAKMLVSRLSNSGILSVSAPKLAIQVPTERMIPITAAEPEQEKAADMMTEPVVEKVAAPVKK